MDSLPPHTAELQPESEVTALTAEEARHLLEHLDDDPTEIVVDFLKELQTAAEEASGLTYPDIAVSLVPRETPIFCLVWPMRRDGAEAKNQSFRAATKAELVAKLKAAKEGSLS